MRERERERGGIERDRERERGVERECSVSVNKTDTRVLHIQGLIHQLPKASSSLTVPVTNNS